MNTLKKILILLIVLLLVGFIACKEEEPTPSPDPVNPDPVEPADKKLTVTYFDGSTKVYEKEYVNEMSPYEYTKEGYQFIGWYLDSGLSRPFNIANTSSYFDLGKIDLFAKMEKNMEDFNIRIVGKINDDEYVVNPTFTWSNSNGDNSFSIALYKGSEVIETTGTGSLFYNVKSILEPNQEYEFLLLGNQSTFQQTIKFKTVSEYNNNIVTISLLNPYADGMVIQRDVENIISGTGPANQLITLTVDKEKYYAISNENGYFEINLPEKEASFTPVNLVVSNGVNATKTISDVLFGDVYLFAGQSNMQWPTKDSDFLEDDIKALINSNVRFFCQDVVTSTTKLDSVKNGRWFKVNNTNYQYFSAIATMSGAFLASVSNSTTPIGIVTAYQGDTNIANWMGSEYYMGSVSTKYLHYNAMVYPLRGTKLNGVVWYQGCNNSAAGYDYKNLLLTLFENYRDLFNSPELPFYVIGLACYDGDSGNNFDFSYVRESQAKACEEDSNAYFISICDDGNPTYIHPTTKRYICERVAKAISATYYGLDSAKEGPTYKSHTVDGAKVTIEFNNDKGLYATGEIKGLYLAGSDGKYFEATASIIDNKLVASSDKVSSPVYIKYGYAKSPFVNIFNSDNFAITPFRTDPYGVNTDILDYESTDKYYFHPDGSKMEVALVDNNLRVSKANDGKGYGSVRLDKWGAIAYQPEGFEFTLKGTNSGASISMRFIEGESYEIWGFKVVDDFEGLKTFTLDVGEFSVMYNKQNNIFEPQKIVYIEVMVEFNGARTFDIVNARFVHIERTKPMSFNVVGASEDNENITVLLSNALFANEYKLTIKDGSDTVIYETQSADTKYVVDRNKFTIGSPYYVYAKAINELGETDATNNGFVFYLKDVSKVIVCNFDFQDQQSLNSYMDSSMSVHAGLTVTLEENGVKIASGGQGWQQFIFKLESGAGDGMKSLQFYADFSNYKGQVILQLADTNWKTYSYTINLQEKNEGIFTLDFAEFLNGTTPFTTQTLMWVMFNFNDTTGNGYVLLDDVSLLE